MSERIADASAKVVQLFYPCPGRRTTSFTKRDNGAEVVNAPIAA